MKHSQPWGIHWFRRDLRIEGNPALSWNRLRHPQRVLGIFCLDPSFLSRSDFSENRFAFFLETLAALRDEMRQSGGDLLVLDQGPDEGFARVAERLDTHRVPKPGAISWNRDYEPFAVERDSRIQNLLERRLGIATHTERDHLLIEPRELFKGTEPGSFYQVFGPFKKKWLSLMEEDEMKARLAPAPKLPAFGLTWKDVLGRTSGIQDQLDAYRERARTRCSVTLPEAGAKAALGQLHRFEKQALGGYAMDRDYPALEGTSRLSVYFKNGSLTGAQVIRELGLLGSKGRILPSATKFLDELIWREFYYHILAHVPRVERTAFQLKYEDLPWENDEARFEAWKEGRTGFPIVDAGMRQLAQTGWMHNRVRMIVASFLTKDLLCDWRWGERYFMQTLLDGDLAPNNGGWQWAASTGCDPQPYFRIFNPTLQGKRFDPQGEYIRRWVPEAASTSYLRPIVDHAIQAKKAVALYRSRR